MKTFDLFEIFEIYKYKLVVRHVDVQYIDFIQQLDQLNNPYKVQEVVQFHRFYVEIF